MRALQERYDVEVERLIGERREKEAYLKELERLRRGLETEEERGKGIRERQERERMEAEAEMDVTKQRLSGEEELLESAYITLQE